jgi:hypothetical protein
VRTSLGPAKDDLVRKRPVGVLSPRLAVPFKGVPIRLPHSPPCNAIPMEIILPAGCRVHFP